MNEAKFRESLSELTTLAKTQKMCVSEEQLAECFPEMADNEEQKKLLLEYLTSQKISVGEKTDLDEYLSMKDKDYLKDYLESLEAIECMEKEELEEIMLSAMAGDSDASRMVLTQFLPRVVDLAKMYAGQGIFLEDLIGEGNLALTQAVQQLSVLEVTQNVWEDVNGFLGKYMMDAMEQMIREEADEKNADRKMLDKVNRVAEAAQELSDEMHRKVSPEEVCANSELTMDDVEEAMRISANLIDTIEMEISEKEE